ncbi:expressed unknown protein [Seminavis robusta]|uniref:Uncharacterized protein n=1 Tax=Seminavis robusta TaxID=568900 RepID=A0A9N8DHY7_9STRA|nr:expressed unknown protein [Seminavis robusta]|eukprot:Sro74_g040720.1 n/a (137) ;mRNA; r:47964-48374
MMKHWFLVFSFLSSALAFSPALHASTARCSHELKAHDDDDDTANSRRDFLAAASLLLWPTTAFADDDATATIHKVDYPVDGKCGQADVPEKVVGLVKTFGGFKDGSCSTEGYTAAQGTASGTGEKDSKRTYDIYEK